MTSKERVSAVLNHRIPDKVPWGEWAIDFDTVSRIIGRDTYYRAKARSQMAFWEGRRDEVVQSWTEDAIEFFRKMDCFDIINISAMASSVAPPRDSEFEMPRKIDDSTWEFASGKVVKYSDVTADITTVHDPTVGTRAYTPDDFAGEPDVTPPDESCFEAVDAIIEALPDRFFMGPSGDEIGIYLLEGKFDEGGGGFTHGLMQYLDNPDTVKAAIRWQVALQNALDAAYIRPGQDAVGWGQDFCSTQGPFISPDMFREFVLPGIMARVANVHDVHHIPVLKHACGNNAKLLDMFVEAGYDAYQSIQRTAGMEVADVKRRYGDTFAAWGGVSVEYLVSGTQEDIRAEVDRCMEEYKPGGRYIFGSTHSIAVGTIYDNFMTMVDEFEKRRAY
jgi:hypothetical protein